MLSPLRRTMIELAVRDVFNDLSQEDRRALAELIVAYPESVNFEGIQYSIEDFTGQSKVLRNGDVILEVGFPLDEIKPKPRSYGLLGGDLLNRRK